MNINTTFLPFFCEILRIYVLIKALNKGRYIKQLPLNNLEITLLHAVYNFSLGGYLQ